MAWLRRGRSFSPGGLGPVESEDEPRGRERRATPGVQELFSALKEDGSHVVLDLGPATAGHLRVYRRFARQIRFAGLLPSPPHGADWTAVLRSLPGHPDRPYDVVLLWDLLDWLYPRERSPLVARLAELTAAGARLFAVVDASREAVAPPVRFDLVDVSTVAFERVGPPRAVRHQLLPAEMERLLEPFQVARAFTLRVGVREYVAVKGTGET